ncbi:hypothetical protein ACWEP4_24145 [Streptomyces sp. NPDC004227]
MHDRLGEAALDMQEAGRQGEDVVCRDETTRATMHLALGSILNAFGYRARPHALIFGHIIAPDQSRPTRAGVDRRSHGKGKQAWALPPPRIARTVAIRPARRC